MAFCHSAYATRQQHCMTAVQGSPRERIRQCLKQTVDLALDLFVHPDGSFTVLDEDEFAVACDGVYEPVDVEGAKLAIEALISLVGAGGLPVPDR